MYQYLLDSRDQLLKQIPGYKTTLRIGTKREFEKKTHNDRYDSLDLKTEDIDTDSNNFEKTDQDICLNFKVVKEYDAPIKEQSTDSHRCGCTKNPKKVEIPSYMR